MADRQIAIRLFRSTELRDQITGVAQRDLGSFVCPGDDQNWYCWVQCVKVTVAVGWGCLRYKEEEEEY